MIVYYLNICIILSFLMFLGAYQPSKDLLLRFYAYFKQATIGPNNQPKPSFWDIINRAKWQAWYDLGDMSKENAMIKYVDELKKVVIENKLIYICSS